MNPRFPRYASSFIFLLGSIAAHGADVTLDTTGGLTITAATDIGATVGSTDIIGAGTLTLNGAGTIGLGNNGPDHIVNVNMTGGLIAILTGVNLQNGGWSDGVWTNNLASLDVASGGTLDVWDGNPVRVDALTGAGTVTISILAGQGVNWAGGRSFAVGVNGSSGIFTGNVTGNGGSDGGSLALTKEGAGTQTLGGTSTYNGGTTVNGGRLVLVNTTTGSANFTSNADLEFNVTSGVRQFNGGTMNGTGNLIKTGNGQMLLGANGSPQTVALTGATSRIDVQGGVLRNEYGNSAWGGNKASLNVAAGAVFDLWDGDTTVDALTGSGTIDKGWSDSKTLTFGVNNGSGTFSGTIFNNNTGLGYGGNSGGNLSLVKNGTGTQVLSGFNTAAGNTSVNNGTLRLVDLITFSSGGGPANTISIAPGATLDFNVGTSTGFTTDGAHQGLGTTGGTTINGAGTWLKTGNGILALGGQGGNGSTVTVAMTGGIIDIQGGTLRNGGWAGGIWSNNKAALNLGNSATFDLWDGNTVFVDALTGTGIVDKLQNAGSNRLLTAGVNGGTGIFSGTIQNSNTIGGGVAIEKAGSGTQTLNGTNTYNGGTTVTGGRLILVNTTTGSANFTSNADLEFNVTSGIRQFNGGTMNGTGHLIKTGNGQMWLGANGSPQTVALTGATSVIDVQGGVLRNEYGNSAWGGNKASLNVAAGAVFDLWDGDTTVDALTGAGTVNKGWSDSKTLTVGVNNGSGTFTGTIFNNNTGLGYGGNGGGDLTISKVGTGTQTFSGAQGYATLNANGGVINLDSPLGTGNSTVNASAVVNFSTSQTLAALNIGDSAVVTLGALIAPEPAVAPEFAAVEVQAVPEPGAVSLLAGGIAALFGWHRRKGTR